MVEAAPVIVLLRSGDYDALHQGLSVAAAAVSMHRPVQLYFFWWALERLVAGRLDEPDLSRDDANATMERRGIPTARALLEVVRGSGLAHLSACTGSLAALGLTPPDVEPHVDELVGWATILKRTRGVVDRFEL